MVHDAEIAAVLMNRWHASGDTREGAIALLREGCLEFTSERGVLQTPDSAFRNQAEFECLLFEDGSRILRLVHAHTAEVLTPWSSIAPPNGELDVGTTTTNARGTYGRPHTDESHLLSD